MTALPETNRIWTVPNLISLLRLLGLAPMLWSAWGGHRTLFFWIMVVLLATDWLDGTLAAVLDQRTTLGARLDSLMDAGMYGAIGLSFWWLEAEMVREHWVWIVGAIGTWCLSAGISLSRFGRMPSYHSRGAKVSWFVMACTAIFLLFSQENWPAPWAFGLVILTNLEAAAMGLVLPGWKADVRSLRQAILIRQQSSPLPSPPEE